MFTPLQQAKTAALTCLAALAISISATANASLLDGLTLIVHDNVSVQNKLDVHGRMAIGGNYSGTNATQLAVDLPSQPGSVTVRIGGNVTTQNQGNIHVKSGSVIFGGTVNPAHAFDLQDAGATATQQAFDITPIWNEVTALSASLANLTTNSTFQILSGNQAWFEVGNSLGPDNTAVFSITDTQLFENNAIAQIDVDGINDADHIVINVTSTDGTVNWDFGNMVGSLANENNSAKIIWNFIDATTINFGSRGFYGGLLAPLASLEGGQNNLYNGAAVFNFDYEGEVYGTLDSPPVTTVPAPAALPAGLLILSAAALRRRTSRA